MFREVWDAEYRWVRDVVGQAIKSGNKNFEVYGYIEKGRIVSAGWMRLHENTDFMSLWGGMTLPDFRKKGFYSEIVKARCQSAKIKGYKYAYTGAWSTSRSPLLKLGFEEFTRIRNYFYCSEQ